jgi:ADP-dependent NAD(P)H-hydrate dehydratase
MAPDRRHGSPAPVSPVGISPDLLTGWPLPAPGRNKEDRGQVLVIGGTSHTPGAVLLAGEAVLRAGAGKLRIATARSVASALAVAVPEALVAPLPTDDDGNVREDAAEELLELAAGADAVLLGPGFSSVERSVALLAGLVPALEAPLVLDALASAYVRENPEGLRHLSGRCVLTVNPTELSRSLRCPQGAVEDDLVGAARRLAETSGAVVLCGGEGKAVAAPDGRAWHTAAGGPGLGVSGSGDVQAGLVAGLLGRGAEPEQAAVFAAHLHGHAGDVLAGRVGEVGFLAREVAPEVPALLAALTPAEDRS